jgi:hypothetical protein
MVEKTKPKLTTMLGVGLLAIMIMFAAGLVLFLSDAFVQAGRGTGPLAVLHDYWWGAIPATLFFLGVLWLVTKVNP